MVVKIDKKITSYEVIVAGSEEKVEAVPVQPDLLDRDSVLRGSTYKIKTPASDHAMYITINDKVMLEGTPDEYLVPFEIFINSKNMEHFMWVIAITRVISAIFRKGGDMAFLVEELKAVFDPRGGYFKKGGKFMPSLVAELGCVLQQHLESIGAMDIVLDTKEFIEKKEEIERTQGKDYLKNALVCPKCSAKSFVIMDGCGVCVECTYSHCG